MADYNDFDAIRSDMLYPAGEPRAATKKEFMDLPENRKLKSNIRGAAIICYIAAGLTALAGFFVLDMGAYVLLDVAILLGLGLGVHLKQSKVCAIALLVYSVFSSVVTSISNGKLSGWLIIIAGVYAVIGTTKLDKQWKDYQQQGL